jgi:hypothetical protein
MLNYIPGVVFVMNCKKAEKKFSAYVENELDSKTRRQLEQHLEECENCAYEWQAFQNTLRMVKDMPAIAPSSDFDWELRLRLAFEYPDKVSLRERLFECLGSRHFTKFTLELREGFKGKPAFAFSGVLAILIILSLGLYFYISPSLPLNSLKHLLVEALTSTRATKSKISTSNEFMVRYVMPEISPRESIEQWSDFNPEAEGPPLPLQGGEQRAEIYLPELKESVQPSDTTDFMDERGFIIGNPRPRSSIKSVVSVRYVLRTVSFNSDNVNNPF